MSLDKLAELLCVDEVTVAHGPRGYALYVKLAGETLAMTVDHDDVAKSVDHDHNHGRTKMHVLAEKLSHLADTLVRGAPRAQPRRLPAFPLRDMRVIPSYVYEERGRQLQRSEPSAPIVAEVPSAPIEPAASTSMPSRFHAIVAELGKL